MKIKRLFLSLFESKKKTDDSEECIEQIHDYRELMLHAEEIPREIKTGIIRDMAVEKLDII